MRISYDLIAAVPSFTAPTLERTLDLRGCKIGEIDNLSATLVG
jgi:hypothetical protein